MRHVLVVDIDVQVDLGLGLAGEGQVALVVVVHRAQDDRALILGFRRCCGRHLIFVGRRAGRGLKGGDGGFLVSRVGRVSRVSRVGGVGVRRVGRVGSIGTCLILGGIVPTGHVERLVPGFRLLQNGALPLAFARHQHGEHRSFVLVGIGDGDNEHMLGFHLCAIRQGRDRPELMIAGRNGDIRHERPFTAPVGGLRAEVDRCAAHCDPGPGLGAAGDHRPAVRGNPHRIEARRRYRRLLGGRRLLLDTRRGRRLPHLFHRPVGNDTRFGDGLLDRLVSLHNRRRRSIARRGLSRLIFANRAFGAVGHLQRFGVR